MRSRRRVERLAGSPWSFLHRAIPDGRARVIPVETPDELCNVT